MGRWTGNLDLYLPSGYINAKGVLDTPFVFYWIVGSRGTGKTVSFLWEVLDRLQPGQTFLFIRRTKTQVDNLAVPELSPFTTVNFLAGRSVQPFPMSKDAKGYWDTVEEEDGSHGRTGPLMGYAASLNTFGNIRGIDLSSVEYIIFDEFIKEKHQRDFKGEAEAFLNMYETVTRNRELSGKNPPKCVCLGNAITLANPYFVYLQWVTPFERMILKDQEYKAYPDRRTMLINMSKSPIAEKKRNTALYQMVGESAFSDMALHNRYGVEVSEYRGLPLKEFNPVVTVGEITIYRHKSEGYFYVSPHRSGSGPRFSATEADIGRFKYKWGRTMLDAYIRNTMRFETYYCEALLMTYLKG